MIKADLIGLQDPTLFFFLLLTYSQERHDVGDVNQKNFILKQFKTIRFMMARIVDLKY